MSTTKNVRVNELADAWAAGNVTIPVDLFFRIISLLNEMEVEFEEYPPETIKLFGYVIHSLHKIEANIKFKEAFTRFFYTEDGNDAFKMHIDDELLGSDGELF